MLLTLAFIVFASASLSWPTPPPAPTAKPVTDNYYGHRIVDRYRYFEHLNEPVVQRFFRQQADYTNAVLDKLGPGRAKMRADIYAISGRRE